MPAEVAGPDRGQAGLLYRLDTRDPAPWQDVGVPHSPTVVLTRRRFIAVAAGATGLALTAACGTGPAVGDPDPILELLGAAERDARELAAADASHGDRAGALRRIADARRIHAERLGELIGEPQAAEEMSDSPAPDSAAVCPPVDEVRRRLRADAKHAGEIAVSSEGARAEIAAAVAAACTAAVEVVLA